MNVSRRSLPLPCIVLSALFALVPARRAAAAEAPLVYRCQSAGAVVYADRPCAAGTADDTSGSFHLRSDKLNGYAPPAAIASEGRAAGRSRPAATPRPRAGSITPRERRRRRCEALQQRIDRVNSLMRAGYHGARGERLRAQWSELKARYYDEKCLGAH